MANTLFDRPLFVKKSRYVQELGSLEDVFDLLEEWPAEKRDTAYEVLAKACRMAALFPLPAIRENVRRFLSGRERSPTSTKYRSWRSGAPFAI